MSTINCEQKTSTKDASEMSATETTVIDAVTVVQRMIETSTIVTIVTARTVNVTGIAVDAHDAMTMTGTVTMTTSTANVKSPGGLRSNLQGE